MNSAHLRNKVGLAVYSTLISIMSRMYQLKDTDPHAAKMPAQPASMIVIEEDPSVSTTPQRALAIRWASVQQTLLSVFLWIVLGFAAGFLIGMLQSG